MKIISIGIYKPIPITSGVDSYITSLLNPLGKNHDVIHYYFFESENEKGHYPNEINFKSKYLESNSSLKNIFEKSKLLQRLRPEFILNKKPLKNIKADIIICDAFTFYVAKYISKKNKSPLILIKHNIEWKYLKDSGFHSYPFFKIYENNSLKKADAIITISMNDHDYISKYINSSRIYYIPSTVNSSIFNQDGPSYAFGNDKLNLLFYGSLDRSMNIEALKFIKNNLIPSLEKEHLLNKIRMNIFGSGLPPRYLKIEDDKNINYLGNVENPGKYIRGADLIIVPVKNSGGMKIRVLETIFCGKPIIVTPEVSEGLPNNFKKFIYVEKDVVGYIKIIKQFLEKNTIIAKIDRKIIDGYNDNVTTISDIINNLHIDNLLAKNN